MSGVCAGAPTMSSVHVGRIELMARGGRAGGPPVRSRRVEFARLLQHWRHDDTVGLWVFSVASETKQLVGRGFSSSN